MTAETPFVWVMSTEALKGALTLAARGQDIDDILIDLWRERDPQLDRVRFAGGGDTGEDATR